MFYLSCCYVRASASTEGKSNCTKHTCCNTHNIQVYTTWTAGQFCCSCCRLIQGKWWWWYCCYSACCEPFHLRHLKRNMFVLTASYTGVLNVAAYTRLHNRQCFGDLHTDARLYSAGYTAKRGAMRSNMIVHNTIQLYTSVRTTQTLVKQFIRVWQRKKNKTKQKNKNDSSIGLMYIPKDKSWSFFKVH